MSFYPRHAQRSVYLFLGLLILCALSLPLPTEAKSGKTRSERKAAEKAFFAENAQRPEVITTKSGLQYEILKAGDGERHPKYRQTIRIHFHGTYLDGSVLDSTLDRSSPLKMRFENVIPGWREGLKLMRVGDKFRFYIPSKLAYGSFKSGSVPGVSTLVFEIELFAID